MRQSTVLLLLTGWSARSTSGVNLGDRAQFDQVVGSLRSRVPEAHCLAVAHSTGLGLEGDVESSHRFADYLVGAPPKGRALRAGRSALAACRAVALVYNAGRVRRGRKPLGMSLAGREVLDEFAGASALYLIGSGNFVDDYLTPGGVTVRWGLAMLIASRCGVPVVASGQQIGPLERKRSRILSRIALRRVSMLGVREPESLRCAEALHLGATEVVLTGDDAWGLPAASPASVEEYLARTALPERFIAAQLRFDRSNGYGPEHVASFASLLDSIANALELPVVFVSFHEGPDSRDRHAADLVMQAMQSEAIVAPGPLDPQLAKAVLSRADIAVGGANHFCVFAASSGVPCVAVHRAPYMRHKLDGLAELWPDRVTSVDLDEPGLGEEIVATLPDILRNARDAAGPALVVDPAAAVSALVPALQRSSRAAPRPTP